MKEPQPGGCAEPEGPAFIHAMFAAIDGRDWDRLPAFFHPECRYSRPGYDPIQGLAALRTFYAHVRIIAEGRHEVERLLFCWNGACAFGRFRGVSRTGDRLEERFADSYRFREGRIAERTTYFFRAAI